MGRAGLVIAFGLIAALLAPTNPLRAAPLARGQLADPVKLNIGLSCQWQLRCINAQERAMTKALQYVAKYHPPQWRIEQCNRNASRGRARVDWIGFDNCVRNETLLYTPPPTPAEHKRSVRHKKRRG